MIVNRLYLMIYEIICSGLQNFFTVSGKAFHNQGIVSI